MKSERIIALLGIGHTNAHVVRKWATQPIPGCRLVCISKFPFATYSGMLPGTLAKQFEPSEMEIELTPLANRANAELILDEVVGLELENRQLLFANRDPIPFDALSIGVGSVPVGWSEMDSPSLVPIKPMQTFVDRLQTRVDECGRSVRCVVVGGGVAGVEVALCLHARLARHSSNHSYSVTIVSSGDEIVGGMSDRSRQKLSRLLADRSIEVVKNFQVTEIDTSTVADEKGNRRAADVVVWATGAAPPPILGKLGLPTDDRGFLATTNTLRTTAKFPIFAVGDSGTIVTNPSPKAGVVAVRQAPVLWKNLQATFDPSVSMMEFVPQDDFLKILNTGDGKAMLEYRRWSFHTRWCWWLKCWIDKNFVNQYKT